MIFSFNKKGVELAIGTLVIISIAVLVVFVLVGYFLGAFGRSGGALSQIIGQGEKGAGGLNVELRCLGNSRMTDKDCAAIGGDSSLCSGSGVDATAKAKAQCSDITDANECSDFKKAKGCYWGVTQ